MMITPTMPMGPYAVRPRWEDADENQGEQDEKDCADGHEHSRMTRGGGRRNIQTGQLSCPGGTSIA